MTTENLTAKDIDLEQTCAACPEQYDAYARGLVQVGYLRLRWGSFTVSCPDYGGEVVYSADIGSGWSGCFRSGSERVHHLNKARKAIAKWVNEHKEVLQI